MQKIKSIAFALVIGTAAVGLSPPTASATVILNVDASGQLTGAQNVDVGGTLFDVTFMDGTCFDLFTGCNDPTDFAFTTFASATLAAQALLDQVFVDTGSRTFDTTPELIHGCTSPSICSSLIPYSYLPTFGRTSTIEAQNRATGPDLLNRNDFPPLIDLTTNSSANFAIFTQSSLPVSEPGTLLLFVGGLAILAAFGHPRRRA